MTKYLRSSFYGGGGDWDSQFEGTQSIMKGMVAGTGGRWSYGNHSQEAERDGRWCFPFYSVCVTPTHGMVSVILRMSLPASVNLIQKICPRCAQRSVS